MSQSSWPQPCVSRWARCLGNWVDPGRMEPPWEWQAPEDSGEQATAHKLKRPQKTPLHPLVFHTENQFSRVFPRSRLASLVSLFIFPWLLATSWPNPLPSHCFLHLKPGSGRAAGQKAGSRKCPHPPVSLDASTSATRPISWPSPAEALGKPGPGMPHWGQECLSQAGA